MKRVFVFVTELSEIKRMCQFHSDIIRTSSDFKLRAARLNAIMHNIGEPIHPEPEHCPQGKYL